MKKISEDIKEIFKKVHIEESECHHTSQSMALLHLLSGKNVFLSGPAGSGKTYVIKKYLDLITSLNPELLDDDNKIAVTSTTGISALNISTSATTIHSWSLIGYDKRDFSEKMELYINDEMTKNEKKLFGHSLRKGKNVKILIIDEISMLNSRQLEYIRELTRDNSNIQVIVSGDFNQLPPVEGEYCFNSYAWKEFDFTYCYLDKVYRAKDEELKEILSSIINNKPNVEKLTTNVNIVDKKNVATINTPILVSTNKDADKINKEKQSKNNNKTNYSKVVLPDKNSPLYKKSKEFLARSNIENELIYKKDDLIMITVNENLNIFEPVHLESNSPELKNGTIATIKDIKGNLIYIETTDKKTNDKYNYIIDSRVRYSENKIEKEENPDTGEIKIKEVEIAYFCQYPFKIAYAISIHKSQGQTYSEIACDLTRCWMPNLGYVSLSRSESLSGLTLIRNDYGKLFSSKSFEINSSSLEFTRELLEKTKQKANKNTIEDIKKVLSDKYELDLTIDKLEKNEFFDRKKLLEELKNIVVPLSDKELYELIQKIRK